MGQFDVEAAEPFPILSGRCHVVRRLTDRLAATANDPLRNLKHARFSRILRA